MKLYTINTGHFKLDGGAMFGVVPKSLWQRLNPADENNMCSWALRCLLVETDNRLILIDTGVGNKQNEKFFGFYYLHGTDTLDKSLAKHGFTRNDITDVFLTHLHFDHAGGAIQRKKSGEGYEPAFPNATYWSNPQHWEWAVNPNPREKPSFLPENIFPIRESGQLKYVPADGKFLTGFDFLTVFGHTEAMMLPILTVNHRKICFMADLFPSVHHIPVPYIMGYDVRPLLTMDEKTKFLMDAIENNWILFFEHDPTVECCTLVQTDKGIRPDKTFLLEEAGI